MKIKALFAGFLNLLWAAALVTLPVTSFPWFIEKIGSLVAPLAALPVFLLLIFGVLPYLLHKGTLPIEVLPMLVFAFVALSATAAAQFISLPSAKERSVLAQDSRALVTLAVGLVFYLVFSAWPLDEKRFRRSMQWLLVGGAALTTWSLMQGYFMFLRDNQFPNWMSRVQDILVLQSPYLSGGGRRLVGLAYEPSWLAHQMVLLYLPLLIAATYERTSAFSFRLWKFSVENLLLVPALAAFYLTLPRIGLLAALAIAIYLFVKVNRAILRRVMEALERRRELNKGSSNRSVKVLTGIGMSLVFVLAYVAIVAGLIFTGSKLDQRMATLLESPPQAGEVKALLRMDENTLMVVTARFKFMERVAYWQAGWNIFNQYPVLGVGLGNAGYFFQDLLPRQSWASGEVRSVMIRLDALPNIKSLWLRLLAETGIIGFSVFAAWYLVLWFSARITQKSRDPLIRVAALAGQMGLLAFLAEGFSIDSFALPYLWILTALIGVAGFVHRKSLTASVQRTYPS